MDKRIGKDGEFSPHQTISGKKIIGAILMRHYLGDGYYVALDLNDQPNQHEIERLKHELFGLPDEDVSGQWDYSEDVPASDATDDDEPSNG